MQSTPQNDDTGSPVFYANGLELRLGNADITLVLKQSNRDVATVLVSFEVAKSLAESIGEMISTLEQISQRPLLGSRKMAELMQKHNEKRRSDENAG